MCTILRALTFAGSKNSFRKPNPLVDASPVIVAPASNRLVAVPVVIATAETVAPALIISLAVDGPETELPEIDIAPVATPTAVEAPVEVPDDVEETFDIATAAVDATVAVAVTVADAVCTTFAKEENGASENADTPKLMPFYP